MLKYGCLMRRRIEIIKQARGALHILDAEIPKRGESRYAYFESFFVVLRPAQYISFMFARSSASSMTRILMSHSGGGVRVRT